MGRARDLESEQITNAVRQSDRLRRAAHGKEYLRVQARLIRFLADRFCEAHPDYQQMNRLNVAIIVLIAESYSEWFDDLVGVGVTVRDFLSDYSVNGGSQRVFDELFPGESVEQFLVACENEIRNGEDSIAFMTHEGALRALDN